MHFARRVVYHEDARGLSRRHAVRPQVWLARRRAVYHEDARLLPGFLREATQHGVYHEDIHDLARSCPVGQSITKRAVSPRPGTFTSPQSYLLRELIWAVGGNEPLNHWTPAN